jgi:hypothetical protein
MDAVAPLKSPVKPITIGVPVAADDPVAAADSVAAGELAEDEDLLELLQPATTATIVTSARPKTTVRARPFL